jgi:heptosyltransferase-1
LAQRYLISRLSALGDVVCSLPAATALKATFPDCHVTWVVDPRFAGIVECCTAVDEVVRCKPGLKPATWPTFDLPFDAALDLQGLMKSALGIARAKADQKLGYHWQREGSALFSVQVLPDPSSLHVVDQYVDVARAAGGQMDRAEFSLSPKDEDLTLVRSKLTQAGVDGAFVAMNAGAGWVTKRWPPEHFAVLISELRALGIPTVLLGGKGQDQEVIAAIARQGAQFTDLSGQTSVRELVALISLSAAHVGGDTGSTHLAAGLGKPAIGLYSITRPQRSCPYGQIQRCHYKPSALADITPAEVLPTVLEALGPDGSRP